MKLHIASPCHENWDTMNPNEQGAFCLSCQKNVIDFSSKSLDEIKSFFNRRAGDESENSHVCGRFHSEQLDALNFDDFFRRYKKWPLLNRIALILVFVFGLSLFSCTPGSNDAPLMGQVEPQRYIAVDTPRTTTSPQPILMGQPATSAQDTIKKPQTKHPKEPPHMIKGEVSIAPDTTLGKCDKKKTPLMGKVAPPKE